MNEQEGVIKYQLDFIESPAANFTQFNKLNHWRDQLYNLELIGQNSDRYQGYGFGNISCRLSPDSNQFIISGTQTGNIPSLSKHHYVTVLNCDPAAGSLKAQGPVKPSSEALTHYAAYQGNQHLQYVFHAHSPDIWQHATALGVPETDKDIEYGTPEMAEAITSILNYDDTHDKKGILSMKGHEDGIISVGETADEAGNTLLNYLKLALKLDIQNNL